MAKRILTSEEENMMMYRDFGVAEWREKSVVLGEDAYEVQKYLKSGIETDMTKMVTLPFPDFVNQYFSRFPSAKSYTMDPGFGYKLYLMPIPSLDLFSEIIRAGAYARKTTIAKKKMIPHRYIEIVSDLGYDIENFIKNFRSTQNLKDIDFKFAYISQYIDTKKAHELGLSIATLFDADEDIRGYNIEGKLEMLNPVARIAVARSIGLYGHDRASIGQISKSLNVSDTYIKYFIDTLLPSLIRTTGEFINKIKPLEQESAAKIMYDNVEYRRKDIGAECLFYLNNCAAPVEKMILSANSYAKVQLYIVAKYFGWTPEQVCKNMTVIKDDIDRSISMIGSSQN